MTTNRSTLLALGTLALLPLAWLAWLHAVDVPLYDQINWNIVDLAEASHAGHVSGSMLAISHNEHQLLFTKLLLVLNVAFFEWSRPLESLACAAAIAAAALAVAGWACRAHGVVAGLATVLIMASLNQWRNVTWGFMLQHGMALLLASLMALHCDRERLRAAPLALFAAAATLASGNGVALWIIGAAILAMQAWRTRCARDVAEMALFAVVGAAAVSLYLWSIRGAPSPTVHPKNLLTALATVVIGPVSSLLPSRPGRLFAGMLVLLLAAAALVWLTRRVLQGSPAAARSSRPLLVLLLFSLGSAAMIALRREGDMLSDVKYHTSLNPLYAVLAIVPAAWTASPANDWRARLALLLTSALFLVASVQALPAAFLTERFDRGNAVASYVETWVGRDAGFVLHASVRHRSDRPDAARQLERLDKAHLLRPSLAAFETRFRQALEHEPPPESRRSHCRSS